jgi:hypothetical protein
MADIAESGNFRPEGKCFASLKEWLCWAEKVLRQARDDRILKEKLSQRSPKASGGGLTRPAILKKETPGLPTGRSLALLP